MNKERRFGNRGFGSGLMDEDEGLGIVTLGSVAEDN
jgi:hypothetical protein